MVTKTDSSLIVHDGGTIKDVLDTAKPIANYTALRAYAGSASQIRITATGIAGFFYYDASDTVSADNGGTIIVSSNGKRWKRLFSEGVYVNWFGALGKYPINDTAAINSAVNYLNSMGGGELHFQPGVYGVSATGDYAGIQLKTGVYLNLNGSKIKAIPANSPSYRLINIEQSNNCGVFSGEVQGDRADNNATGEHGHGINIIYNCANVTIRDVKVYDCFGDGIYTGRLCNNVKILNSTVTNNRRNNISVVSTSNILIDGNEISYANGTAPETGIDVEPNIGDLVSRNVIITNNRIYGNAKQGVDFPGPYTGVLVENAVVAKNHIYENGQAGIKASYIKNITIDENHIYKNGTNGIVDSAALASSMIIRGNIIHSNGSTAIDGFASNSNISGNTISNHMSGYGIRWKYGQNVTIAINKINSTGEDGVLYERAYNSIITGNSIKNTNKHGIFITGTSTSSATKSRSLTVSGNSIAAASLLADNTYSGIYLDANANTSTISGNIIERAPAGTILDVYLTNGGAGFTIAPTVTITGGGGINATATAIIDAGKVIAVQLTNSGSGYTSAPVVTISGDGVGATAVAMIGNQPLHAIYVTDSTVLISGNMTNSGAKSGNTQVRVGSIVPASFIDSPNMGVHFYALRYYMNTGPGLFSGAGSPEGTQSAPPGSLYLRTDGAANTTFYVKETGTGNTGWVAK